MQIDKQLKFKEGKNMSNGMHVQMSTSSMITYLSLHPVFEQSEENRLDAINLCHKVLACVYDETDNSVQVGMVAVTYLIAELMQLDEIFKTDLMMEFLNPKHGFNRLCSDAIVLIRELAQEDYEGYIEWITPFLNKAGVINIIEELEDFDSIQKLLASKNSR